MKRSLIGLIAPLAALALVACGPEEEESTVSTGGTTTTEEGVEISLGSGSGSSFREGVMSATIGASSLSAGGTTTVTVNIVNVANNNSLYTGVPVEVQFASSCVDDGKASFSRDSVSTSTGTATTVYQAEGCVGSDAISASVDSATAAVAITVSPADVNSIGFQGLSASSIAYGNSSTSNQPNITTASFQLLDARGNPVEGQTVTFSISSSDTNNGTSLSNTSSISDSDGVVATRLNAGTAAANVRVVATFTAADSSVISTQSTAIAVNTGPADWDSFVMGPDKCAVPGAFNIFNKTAQITAIAADRHNNPVADGTEISFWTEQGRIQPTCQTADGSCSVTWYSGGGTPINEDDDSDLDADEGLSTIVAYTVGEDSFIELTEKNGIFDVGETIVAAPEMFHDYEFDLTYNAGTDTYVDYDNSGSYDADNGGIYRGALCSDAAVTAGHCAETSAIVWGSTRITLSTSGNTITASSNDWDVSGGPQSFTVFVTDLNGNYPPAGTTLEVEVDGVEVEVFGSPSLQVCPGGQGSIAFSVFVDTDGTGGTTNAPVLLTVTSADGVKSYLGGVVTATD